MKYRQHIRLLFTLSLIWTEPLTANQEQQQTQSFEDFSSFRHDLTKRIAAAKHRVWLSTDFLSDGEIVSALYIAQYRKIEVQVLLGRANVNKYMSRLRDLKKQNIPVHLSSHQFSGKFPATHVIIDQDLISANHSLDFKLTNTSITMNVDHYTYQNFEKEFAAMVEKKIPGRYRPLPLVGTPKKHNNWKSSNYDQQKSGNRYQPPSAYAPRRSSATSYNTKKKEDTINTYYYNRNHPKPEGVPNELPSKTKQQLKNNIMVNP